MAGMAVAIASIKSQHSAKSVYLQPQQLHLTEFNYFFALMYMLRPGQSTAFTQRGSSKSVSSL
jgi:hypothetical protein